MCETVEQAAAEYVYRRHGIAARKGQRAQEQMVKVEIAFLAGAAWQREKDEKELAGGEK